MRGWRHGPGSPETPVSRGLALGTPRLVRPEPWPPSPALVPETQPRRGERVRRAEALGAHSAPSPGSFPGGAAARPRPDPDPQRRSGPGPGPGPCGAPGVSPADASPGGAPSCWSRAPGEGRARPRPTGTGRPGRGRPGAAAGDEERPADPGLRGRRAWSRPRALALRGLAAGPPGACRPRCLPRTAPGACGGSRSVERPPLAAAARVSHPRVSLVARGDATREDCWD